MKKQCSMSGTDACTRPSFFLHKLYCLLPTRKLPAFHHNGFSALIKPMNEWSQKEWMNGAVALVIRNGKIAYYKAAGYNDIAAKTPMQKEGIFRIASQSKAITSVAVMMLFEEGKLLLDDPVSKYIPAFKKQTVLDKFNADDTSYTGDTCKKRKSPFVTCLPTLPAWAMRKLAARKQMPSMQRTI